MGKKLNLNKGILHDLYWNEKLTARQIATKFNCCPRSIFNYMIRFKIKTRNVKEAMKLLDRKGKNNYFYKKSFSMDKHGNWKGGIRRGDYIEIKVPYHPHSNKAQYVPEHRLVIEAKLNNINLKKWINFGRNNNYSKNSIFLDKTQIIHHIDENKYNNKLSNLYLCNNNAEHSTIHKYAYSYLVKINKHKEYINFFKKEFKQ